MSIAPFSPRRIAVPTFRHTDRNITDRRRRSARLRLRFVLESLEDRRLLSAVSSITEFSSELWSAGSNAWDIVAGPDGNMWFTEATTNKIAFINPTTQVMTELDPPTASAGPRGITLGPDGNIWFAENAVGKIGMVNPTTHVMSEFPVKKANSGPEDIVVGPDGNLWFTEFAAGKVGMINPTTHVVKEFALANSAAQSDGITAGPDGNIWFLEDAAYKIASINPTTHAITEYPVLFAGLYPTAIAAGPDGNLWYSGTGINTFNPTTHAATEILKGPGASGIVTGPDGAVWLTQSYSGQPTAITRVDPASYAVTQYPVNTGVTNHPHGLAVGPDGNLWFTDGVSRARVGVATLSTSRFVLTQQPPSTLAAGSSFGLMVEAVDGSGNPITTFNDPVTVSLGVTNNIRTPAVTLGGATLTTTAINGAATFSGLTLPTGAGFYYTISVSGGGLGWGESDKINIIAAAPTQIGIPLQPPTKVGVGQAFSLQAGVYDAYWNQVTTVNGGTLSVSLAANPAGGVLGGALTATIAQGVATFSNLTLSKVGTGYTLQVGGAGFTAGVTSAIEVTKKAQNLSAAVAANAPPASIAALVPDAPNLWDGLGRKKRATDL